MTHQAFSRFFTRTNSFSVGKSHWRVIVYFIASHSPHSRWHNSPPQDNPPPPPPPPTFCHVAPSTRRHTLIQQVGERGTVPREVSCLNSHKGLNARHKRPPRRIRPQRSVITSLIFLLDIVFGYNLYDHKKFDCSITCHGWL